MLILNVDSTLSSQEKPPFVTPSFWVLLDSICSHSVEHFGIWVYERDYYGLLCVVCLFWLHKTNRGVFPPLPLSGREYVDLVFIYSLNIC